MKNFKPLAVLTLLGAAFCMPSPSQAQTITSPQINAVGSSGTFTTVVIAMVSSDSSTGFSGPVCGSRVWTGSSGSKIYGVDPRGVPNEPGNLAVVWDVDSNPGVVCSYFSVDSIVGDRLLLAQSGSGGVSGNGTIHIDATYATTTAGANKVSYVKDTATAGLPPAVWTVLHDQHFNVAFTDIRPDDAEYAANRANCSTGSSISCFGYGPAGTGQAILSTFNTNNQANTVQFSVSGGQDPINTSLTVPATTILNIGAYPILVFYNNLDTSATCSLGTLAPTNVLSHVVSAFWTGRLESAVQLTGSSCNNNQIVDVVQREPISGTYNTFEFQGVEDREADLSLNQESGFGPNSGGLTSTNCFTVPGTATYISPSSGSPCANPMNVPGLSGHNHRFRAIGTGEMISAVDSSNGKNRIGYAFFGLGSFGNHTNIRYMALDGVDPLFASYSTVNGNASNLCTIGTFINTTPALTCPNSPTFTNVINGSYRIWNIIRAVYYSSYTAPSSGPSIPQLIAAAQDQAQATQIHDFVPFQYCGTSGGGLGVAPISSSVCTGTSSAAVLNLPNYRLHYPLPNITTGVANPGNPGCSYEGLDKENGGDMAGAILPVLEDVVTCNLTGGNYFTDYIQ